MIAEERPGDATPHAGKKQGVGNGVDGGEAIAQAASSSKPHLLMEEDLMQLARLGELGMIQRLFEAEKYDARYRDEQGITALHWAAIKNHMALCHYLIGAGADVNAPGGDLSATPVLWAARSCNYYVVDLLLRHGADPLRTDSQGFNLLQNATLDGNVYQVLLLLYRDVPVDTPDPQGHTSLMWAAYKGYPACVEALLRFGAAVDATDDGGFTALHWALVKGSQECVQRLVEYGADRFAATGNGKTPAVVAEEMHSKTQWQRALSSCGYDADGNLRQFPISSTLVGERELFLSRFFFSWPFLVIFVGLFILSAFPIYIGFPLGLLSVGGLQAFANSNRFLQWMPPHKRSLAYTSYVAGVFAATLFWVGLRWLTQMLPWTYETNPILNLAFLVFYCFCAYFYLQSMFEDPGWIPKVDSRTEQRALVDELIENESFNDKTFCTTCLLRRPLRSRHCRRCNRCVAKQDHHCPWINNCVAANNHRHFFFYIVALELGIMALIWLTMPYLELLPPADSAQCTLLSDEICAVYSKDPFTILLVFWSTLQLTWVTMLIFSQLVQIARARTTLESMRHHDHMSAASAAVTAVVLSGTTATEDVGLAPRTLGLGPDQNVTTTASRRPDGFLQTWKRLLGVDTFMANAAGPRTPRNPYSRGIVQNCSDFFLDPAPVFGARDNGAAVLGGRAVNYARLYDLTTATSSSSVDAAAPAAAVYSDQEAGRPMLDADG